MSFDKIYFWCQNYGRADVEDKRAVKEFVEIESDEVVKPFLTQLHTIADGNYDEEILDQQVGLKRRAKHGSYSEWAKLMLRWIREPGT
jgi:hypothetical protein